VNEVSYYLLAGLGLGALYAMLGSGLVIIFRGSGVINFAHGAFAMYGVFTFDQARRTGHVFLPWVDILPTHWLNLPVDIRLSDRGVSTQVAFVVAVLMAVLLGLLAHFLVFRPLKDGAALGKVVASVGVMLYLQGVAQLNFGSGGRKAHDVLSTGEIRNFLGLGRTFPTSSISLVAIALLIGGLLWALFRFTRFGLATRGAAGSEKGAVLLGYSPQLLAAVNWVLASVLATVAAILVGSLRAVGALQIGTLTPLALSGLVVAALSAALIGGMRSIMVATLSGLALGAVQSLLDYETTMTWFPAFLRSGVREVVPLAVIVAVLFLRGTSLSQRGALEEKRLPLSPRPKRVPQHVIIWSAAVVVAAFAFEGSGPRVVFAFGLSTSLIAALIMLSMVVVTGYVGQISLVQMSLAGIAAFFVARMLANGTSSAANPFPINGPDLPWAVAALIAVAVAVVVGVVIGLPAVRIRGVQLAVVTTAVAVALQPLYFQNNDLSGAGANGLAVVRAPFLFGASLAARGDHGLSDRPAFTILVLVALVLCSLAVANLRRNGTGRRFLAVRANERAAASVGIDVSRTKLLAFGIGSAIAGTGGVLLAVKQGELSGASFISQASLTYLAFAYLGGITSVNGAIVGGILAPSAFFTVTSNYFLAGTNIDKYITIVGGAALALMAIVSPNGIAPGLQRQLQILGRWLLAARAAEWRRAVARFGPTVAIGIVAGYVIWPARDSDASAIWMPLLGAAVALAARALLLGIIRRRWRSLRAWQLTARASQRERSANRRGEHATRA
jgi:branched-chain amino acid transport system permease protein